MTFVMSVGDNIMSKVCPALLIETHLPLEGELYCSLCLFNIARTDFLEKAFFRR